MVALEYWARIIRLPFVVSFAVAAWVSLMNIATGWVYTFLLWVFWPFILATIILEILQISAVLERRRKHQQDT